MPPAAGSGQPTTVIDYAPERPGGDARTGSCWTNSLSVPSRAAWRCRVGAQVLDPCFVLTDREVVCNPNPLARQPGTLVTLSEPLPRPDLMAGRPSRPWLIQVDDRTTCAPATGATGVVGEKPISYLCASAGAAEGERVVILGEPQPGPTWTAEKATLTLREAKAAVVDSGAVPLRAIVRGPAPLVPYLCAPLAEALAEVLGADVARSEAPVTDPVTDEGGTGCRVAASRTGDSTRPTGELARKLLAFRGWQEDRRYQPAASGPSALFRRASALCLLSAQSGITLICAQDRALPGPSEARPREPERIQFEPDATVGVVRRPIAEGEIQEYVLRAFAGQTMIVDAGSPGGDVFLSVYRRSDGTALHRPTGNARRWQGKLPASDDYLVRAAGRGQDTTLSLSVVIPAAIETRADGRPVVITGELRSAERRHYLLRGRVDQSLAVAASSPGRDAFVVVTGLDDNQTVVPAAFRVTSWTGRLPGTQDYLVEVVSAGGATDYGLEVTVR
ncbi:MAG TPA: hypothetical protein VG370_12875 [Chloroflexota bacterium]|nr:hypothetical protein [Chloroflexota bacterium]